MKYLCFLYLFISLCSCVHKNVKLTQSLTLIQKENMPSKYSISRYFEYDNQNRLLAWTDSTYNSKKGGIIVEKELVVYDDEGKIISLMSYRDGEQRYQLDFVYENNTIKLKVPDKFNEESDILGIIELNKNGSVARYNTKEKRRSNTMIVGYDKQGNLKTIKVDSNFKPYYKVYEYGNNKGIFHDVNMPPWFWIVTDNGLQGMAFYNKNVQSVTITKYSGYTDPITTTLESTMEFDEDGYPVFMEGIITNGFTLKVKYKEP